MQHITLPSGLVGFHNTETTIKQARSGRDVCTCSTARSSTATMTLCAPSVVAGCTFMVATIAYCGICALALI